MANKLAAIAGPISALIGYAEGGAWVNKNLGNAPPTDWFDGLQEHCDRASKSVEEMGAIACQEEINQPKHYAHASPIARPALMCLGIDEQSFEIDCCEALEKSVSPLLSHAYPFNACKYLWRCGEKNSLIADLRKAEWYLVRYIEKAFPVNKSLIMSVKSCLAEVYKLISEYESENG